MMKSSPLAAHCVEFFYAKPGCLQLLRARLLDFAKAASLETGCLQYEVLRDKENSDLLIVIVQFDSAENMLKHEQQPMIQEFADKEMSQYCETVHWYDAMPV